VGGKWYYTAAELAELALPGLSKAKRKVNERAVEERWALQVDAAGAPLARQRKGRGGGLEYHVDVIPASARLEIAKRGLIPSETAPAQDDGLQSASRTWSWYEAQPESAKAEARRRASIIARVEAFERGNLTRSAAVGFAAAEAGMAGSTLWGWLALVEGVDANERLPFLATRRIGGGAEAEVDEGAWKFLISDYLRPERPTFASCYHRCARDYCAPRGLVLPHVKTLSRKLQREVDGRMIIAKREGAEALRLTLPPQKRTVAHMHALELVNIDGHKFDVFTQFDNGRIGRPIMVAIQDVYSRKILAWRLGETENAVLTRLTFADLFTKWGIPKGCLLDNGRAFASKWITGGAKTRFRFKIREEDPTGILTALGIAIHWAKPHRGQSKPIERSFRDLEDIIGRHPAVSGAYTGHHIDAKPENYGSRAIPIGEFSALVAAGVAAHNAKRGRRTEMARGASFDEVFNASYIAAPIGKASSEQLRLALLTADEVSTCRQSGTVTLYGNRYWAPELSQLAGKKVTVRFDPDDLTRPIHVYDKTGRFLVSADVLEQTGFLDAGAAKARARQEGDYRKAMRRAIELEQLLSADELAAMSGAQVDEAPIPSPTVLRPVRHRGHSAAAARAVDAQQMPEVSPFIDRFAAGVNRLRVVE